MRSNVFNRLTFKRTVAATVAVVLAIVQLVVQSRQDQLGVFFLAVAIAVIGVAAVTGLSRLRGTRASPRIIGLTIVLAPTIVFFGLGPYYTGLGLGFGIACWILYLLFRVAFRPAPSPSHPEAVAPHT